MSTLCFSIFVDDKNDGNSGHSIHRLLATIWYPFGKCLLFYYFLMKTMRLQALESLNYLYIHFQIKTINYETLFTNKHVVM